MYSLLVLTSFSWRLYFPICDLDVLDLVLEVAALLLVLGHLVLGVGDELRGGLDPLVDVLDEAGDAFEDEGRVVDLGVQALELDDQVEVDFHYPCILVLSVNGPTRIRTWDQPVMSRWLYR